jgi:hypothetical protein
MVGGQPLTGASTNSTCRDRQASPTRAMVFGAIGGQVDMDGTRMQPGKDTGLRFQHRCLEFGGAGKRRKHHFTVARHGEDTVGAHYALRAQFRRGIRAAVINCQRMAGANQAARDWCPHRSGPDKADPHRVAAPRVG